MPVPIAGLYAGLLALLLIVVAVRVISLRWRFRVGTGDGGERLLHKAVRAHGNAAEWIPIALILLVVAELNRVSPTVLHACGAIFVAARVLHAIGLTRSSGPSWPRALGVVGTLGSIAVLGVYAIAAFVQQAPRV